MTMQLQFSHQDYQKRAVDAVVEVFKGQPLAKSDFALAAQSASVRYAPDGTIGNALVLSSEQLLANVQRVQRANLRTANGEPDEAQVSTHLLGDDVPDMEAGVSADGAPSLRVVPHLSLEMETGTGKTYTFIKTVYELNKQYGFKKFVVVVPSVAIREGTIKNLEITRTHFANDYAHVPCVPILYDSSRLSDLRDFAQSDALCVLVINIDSFAKDGTRIKQKGEKQFAPIAFIQKTLPVVIVDEPQNFETDLRRSALQDLNPLCTLRYSATHRNPYNLLYSLNPVQAYDLGLVKQIEVDGVLADADHSQAFIEVLGIEARARTMSVRLAIDVNGAAGAKRAEVKLKLGDDLFAKSKQREVYQDGYTLNEIRADVGEIEFSGGRVLRLHERQGGMTDDVMRFQIERTVAAHFAKLKALKPLGIKVLSLFFIDKVANYRAFDADGQPTTGKFGLWFETAFDKYARLPQYQGLFEHTAREVHDGYFSGEKRGKGAKAQTVWVDTSGQVAKDDSTYHLIMRDKERLLSLAEPLQFLFSHTALREGWDNPNVFQICTLNETQSAMKKRQEIGRGLRLCVNQQGERVLDKRLNVLTVIPNESYEAFAKALQQEIEDETGVRFEGRVKNARAKVRVARKALSAEDEALFQTIWHKINYQTRYSVRLDTPTLIDQCAKALADKEQYPPVYAPKIRASKGRVVMGSEGVQAVLVGVGEAQARPFGAWVPDVYGYIQNRVHLSRATIFAILQRSGRMDELLVNSQAFLDTFISAVKTCLQALMVDGIEYHCINGKTYAMSLLDTPLETYLSGVYPPAHDPLAAPLAKTLLQAQPIDEDKNAVGDAFDCVLSESEPERGFARDCNVDERVRFFFKLPSTFKIPTPLGTYNPDWAVVFTGDSRVYFVVETKSSTFTSDRRTDENLKINCGHKHFELAGDVVFATVTALSTLTDQRSPV